MEIMAGLKARRGEDEDIVCINITHWLHVLHNSLVPGYGGQLHNGNICGKLFPLADKEWKRRFFQEKKLTSNLEDQIKQTKNDLHVMHGKVDHERGTHLKGQWNYSHAPGFVPPCCCHLSSDLADSIHASSVAAEGPSEHVSLPSSYISPVMCSLALRRQAFQFSSFFLLLKIRGDSLYDSSQVDREEHKSQTEGQPQTFLFFIPNNEWYFAMNPASIPWT